MTWHRSEDEATVLLEVKGRVAHVTLNRPHCLNAIDHRLPFQLRDAVETANRVRWQRYSLSIKQTNKLGAKRGKEEECRCSIWKLKRGMRASLLWVSRMLWGNKTEILCVCVRVCLYQRKIEWVSEIDRERERQRQRQRQRQTERERENVCVCVGNKLGSI